LSLRIAILTGTDIRHRFFVNALTAHCDVVFAGYQSIAYVPAHTAAQEIDTETAALVRRHFDERRRQEEIFFGHNAEPLTARDGCAVQFLDTHTLNSSDTADALERQGVDVVLVYGTDLIKPPLIERFAHRMINMHLGLSPYYRGTATNFYPLLNEEPEFVGATIHLIDPGIDSGAILHHARPEIVADDMPHTVGCKAILAGIEKVVQSLHEFETSDLNPIPQWPVERARLYLRKDYHRSQVVRLYELIDAGLFPKYAERKHRVQGTFRLIP